MKDMTIQNTAGAAGEQAVALRAGGDQQAFSNVNLEGYQVTIHGVIYHNALVLQCIHISLLQSSKRVRGLFSIRTLSFKQVKEYQTSIP